LSVTTSQLDSGSTSQPTVLRMLLGAQLRRLREGRGVTREAAGYEIRGSESKISRMELGRVGFKERDVADLLTLYGVVDETDRAPLLSMARDSNAPNWWQRSSDVMPSWFQAYVGLEAVATLIRSYEAQLIPGLLQTPDYARAAISGGMTGTPAAVDRRIEMRMRRQQILTRDNPPQLWSVIDEAALRRMYGGPHVMRGQIAALIEATKRPNVTIQVVPFRVGAHVAEGIAFSLLRFAEPELPDVVYTEQLTTALYLDRRDDVDHYATTMERLCIQAEPPESSVRTLERVLGELDGL
jgi:transcriptional regulator with XRE-family HTH domain